MFWSFQYPRQLNIHMIQRPSRKRNPDGVIAVSEEGNSMSATTNWEINTDALSNRLFVQIKPLHPALDWTITPPWTVKNLHTGGECCDGSVRFSPRYIERNP
mmetsp:Transcript_8939/g.20672  ORF Transcript_8939/g.20672 Transcript_8939/m.20672 type:complete len:102 (-) Transcript_8939:633-938(-)